MVNKLQWIITILENTFTFPKYHIINDYTNLNNNFDRFLCLGIKENDQTREVERVFNINIPPTFKAPSEQHKYCLARGIEDAQKYFASSDEEYTKVINLSDYLQEIPQSSNTFGFH